MHERDVRRDSARTTLGTRHPRLTLVFTRNPVARAAAQAQIGRQHPYVTTFGAWLLWLGLLAFLAYGVVVWAVPVFAWLLGAGVWSVLGGIGFVLVVVVVLFARWW